MRTSGQDRRSKAPRPKGRGVPPSGKGIKKNNHSLLQWLYEHIVAFTRRNRVALQSGGIFILCLGVSIFAYSKFVDENYNVLAILTAKASGAILSIFSSDIHVDGVLVSSNLFSMRVVALCTGIVPIMIFLSAVIAYPCRIKPKLVGIVMGTIVICLINLVRMVTIFYIGSYAPSFFDTAHGLMWQSLIILIAILLWLFWAEKLTDGRNTL
jgi:archaeosortase B (VPXXXP-CTERM-specific)